MPTTRQLRRLESQYRPADGPPGRPSRPRRRHLELPIGNCLSSETASGFDDEGILRRVLIGNLELAIGLSQAFGIEHCQSALTDQVGPISSSLMSQSIESRHQFII